MRFNDDIFKTNHNNESEMAYIYNDDLYAQNFTYFNFLIKRDSLASISLFFEGVLLGIQNTFEVFKTEQYIDCFMNVVFCNMSEEMFSFKLKEQLTDRDDMFNMSIFYNLVMETEAFSSLLSKKMCETLLFIMIKITDKNEMKDIYNNKITKILYKM